LGNSQIGLDAITDDKADVFMNARNLGDSLVKDIASKRPLLWIDGDVTRLQKAADTFHFKADLVPKGTYPFMEKDYPTVRMWVSLLAGSHVPDEVVYKYVKAIAENEARVQSIGGSLKTSFSTAKMATDPANLAFHLDIAIFIAITFPIAFLTTTANLRRNRLAWTDVVLAAASLAVALYYIVLNDRFLNWSRGFSQPTTGDVIVGFALVVLVIELCRRSVGWGLTSLVLVLLVFTFFGHWMPGPLRHDNFGVPYFIEMMTIMENGVFGAPLEVAATYAFLFVLFR